ncbi:hypothetical protein PHPALM_28331 [Phytophthora palmivora]|uniref:Uncharacterized protein n=1 Tax=Phytophthora palmivora TaxID=4796 RepID=A0A2P4XAC9_9STRA|nr:hypothetical protein PHPALM_28331 [Phytophthora palmivora]
MCLSPIEIHAEAYTKTQNGSTSTAEATTLLRNSEDNSKPSSHSYGSPTHTTAAEEIFNKRLSSRSQPYRESNTPPLTPQQTNWSPDWLRKQPPQSATPRFWSKEK